MKYGKFLKKNGTIGFVAPSFGCNIEPYKSGFDNAQKILKQQGYQIAIGPNAYEGSGIGISNTPEKCAEEFNQWYLSDKNDVLISCGGGELMCDILDQVDFAAIAEADPKWFMGYSDNTNLTFLLTTLCDTASIYGPCAATFGMEPWHKNLHDAFGLLTGQIHSVEGYDLWEKESLKSPENPCVPYNVTEPKILSCYPAGQESYEMSGRLLGGCLDILMALCGTKFDQVKTFSEKYKEDGIIWFMEACDLNPLSIHRAVWQLEHAGWFQYTKGFIIGRPWNGMEPVFGLDEYQAVIAELGKYNVPVIMDADLGHLAPSMPLVCGSYANVTVHGNDIRINMEYR